MNRFILWMMLKGIDKVFIIINTLSIILNLMLFVTTGAMWSLFILIFIVLINVRDIRKLIYV